ncbi:hypothetical protein [Streptomyces sp. AC627_RSS907]|uniref:hypothetical protein n=1 Tax=Streptomyces sp. AC627_RSS907 TaxID=2823684 RepID=UPI001C22E4FF|nr:hypothetical protein [Streptomyces sp. AC627_RSS907]
MSPPHQPAEPPSGTPGTPAPTPSPREGVTDPVRRAAFGCLLVPLALPWCGTSFAGAAGTALGPAALTGACRLLPRRPEQRAARGPGAGKNTPVD